MKLSPAAALFGAAVAAFFPGASASADKTVSSVLFLCFVQVQVVFDAHCLWCWYIRRT